MKGAGAFTVKAQIKILNPLDIPNFVNLIERISTPGNTAAASAARERGAMPNGRRRSPIGDDGRERPRALCTVERT